MSIDDRGTISQTGRILNVEHALVEEVSSQNGSTGFLVISYVVINQNGMISIERLRLNISQNTILLTSFGQNISVRNIQKGNWIDAAVSPNMTRSIPPQTTAFLIVVKCGQEVSGNATTERIGEMDWNNHILTTGNPNDIYSQTRFVFTDTTPVSDHNGNPVSLGSLRPGQFVRITHANYQTASIPPQTTVFHIQLL